MKIAVCNRNTEKRYKNKEMSLEDIKERNPHPIRTSEIMEEYPKLPKAQRDIAKDQGGFVGGWLRGGIRKKGHVISRECGALDADHIPEGENFLGKVLSVLAGVRFFIYSTHSHTLQHQRYRLVMPFSREVSEEEYAPFMRMVAKQIGMEYFDDSTYQANRMMYWASCPSNGEFIFEEQDGDPLDVDAYLAKYDDWRDVTQWPVSSRQSKAVKHSVSTQANPLQKSGIVGAFCRAYTIEEVIEKNLSDVYTPSALEGRYDYILGEGTAGVVVYDGKFAYSHHATDPASEKLLNAFDLVRIHKFGDDDSKKSFAAMAELASRDELVSSLLLAERREMAAQDFEGSDWETALVRDKNSLLVNSLRNLKLIMEHDSVLKGIVFNQLADNMEIRGEVPWKHPGRFWRDADEAQLICYVDDHYGTFSARNHEIGVTEVADDRSYHPIREFLDSLPPWDKVQRLDTLLIDYLGAPDNAYVRAVTRKTLCAAVARVRKPGIKFDNILVLNGPQGIGKSTIVALLGGEWYSDSLSLTDMNTRPQPKNSKATGSWKSENLRACGKPTSTRSRRSFRGRMINTEPVSDGVLPRIRDSASSLARPTARAHISVTVRATDVFGRSRHRAGKGSRGISPWRRSGQRLSQDAMPGNPSTLTQNWNPWRKPSRMPSRSRMSVKDWFGSIWMNSFLPTGIRWAFMNGVIS